MARLNIDLLPLAADVAPGDFIALSDQSEGPATRKAPISALLGTVLFNDHFTGLIEDTNQWLTTLGWAGIDAAGGVLRGTAGISGVNIRSRIDFVTRALDPIIEYVVTLSDNSTNVNFAEVGLDGVDGITDSFGPDFILRFFDNDSPNWYAQVWNGGDELLAGAFDTGVPATVGVPQVLRTEETASDIKFFIDGVLVYSQSTKLPPLTTERGIEVGYSIASGSATIDLDRVTVVC